MESVDVKCVFSTNTDTAEAIIDQLLYTPNTCCYFYCICHNLSNYNINAESISLTLCLPIRKITNKKRIGEIFSINIPMSDAIDFLRGNRPLLATELNDYIDRNAVKKTFKPILDILMLTSKKVKRGDFRSEVFWLKSKLSHTLRVIYKLTISSHWLISNFGPFESQFVLTSSYFFFNEELVTTETLSNIFTIFSKIKGCSLIGISTNIEMGQIFGKSKWLEKMPTFSSFVKHKLNKDDNEIKIIQRNINKYRSRLMLSNTDLIQYIYLAYYQCFNQNTFRKYSQLTNYENIFNYIPNKLIFPGLMDVDFIKKMKTYFTSRKYIKNHVHVKKIFMPCRKLPQYSYYQSTAEWPKCQMKVWVGECVDISKKINEINKSIPKPFQISPDLKGFIQIASKSQKFLLNPKLEFVKNVDNIPSCLPVFRTEFLNRQYFMMVNEDCLNSFIKYTVTIPLDINKKDLDITQSIMYDTYYFSKSTLTEQAIISRHEYFNANLPVYNIVLDMDLKLLGTALSYKEIYQLTLAVRKSLISLMKTIGRVESYHPVYFFKSGCPSLNESIAREEHFTCVCTEKIGMRVITPLPKKYAIVGADPIKSFVKILDRIVKLDKHFYSLSSKIDLTAPIFDTGIYNHGRCIRLPYTYKVEKNGSLHKLLKIFVCHPQTEKSEYLNNILDVKNLHYHSIHKSWPQPTYLVHSIYDDSEDFLTVKTYERLPKTASNCIETIETVYNLNIIEWVKTIAWPKIYQYLCECLPPNKLYQFSYIQFLQTNSSIIQLCNVKGKNFECLRYNHRNTSKNVRVFLTLYCKSESSFIATFMTQCFAGKCGSNKATAHFSVTFQK